MALNRTAVFPNTFRVYVAQATTAEASLTAPTNVATVYPNTSGAAAKCTLLRVKANMATTASNVRIFLYDGTTYYLWKEVLTATLTPSGTVKSFEWEEAQDIDIPTGWSIRATTVGGDDVSVFAHIGEYLYTA